MTSTCSPPHTRPVGYSIDSVSLGAHGAGEFRHRPARADVDEEKCFDTALANLVCSEDDRKFWFDPLVGYAVGRAAQRRLDPERRYDATCITDRSELAALASMLCETRTQFREYVAEIDAAAEALVREHWSEIQAVAGELRRHGRLDQAGIMAAIASAQKSRDRQSRDDGNARHAVIELPAPAVRLWESAVPPHPSIEQLQQRLTRRGIECTVRMRPPAVPPSSGTRGAEPSRCVDVMHDGSRLWLVDRPEISAATLDELFELLPGEKCFNIIGGPLPDRLRSRSRRSAARMPAVGEMLYRMRPNAAR